MQSGSGYFVGVDGARAIAGMQIRETHTSEAAGYFQNNNDCKCRGMGGASPDACRHGGIDITRCSACSNGLREWAVIAQARERLQAEGEGGRSFRKRAESGWGGEGGR